MKQVFFFLLPLAVACSGPSSDEPAATDSLETVTAAVEEIEEDPAKAEETKNSPEPGTLMETEDGREYTVLHVDDFPHQWSAITLYKEDGQDEEEARWVLFQPCDASNRTYNFSQEDDGWAIIEGDGHGATFYYITEIRMYNPSYYELYTECEFMTSNTNNVMFTVETYSSTRHTAQWSMTVGDYTSNNNDSWYVNEKGKDEVPVIEQPCVECWGDDCDEMEAAKGEED